MTRPATFASFFAGSNSPVETIREDLHRHPETAFHEFRTASLVAEYLDELGFEVQTGRAVMDPAAIIWPPKPDSIAKSRERALAHGANPEWVAKMEGGLTGVVATLTRGEGPKVGFRFDIDALPVTEVEDDSHRPFVRGYNSVFKGEMHACGHDGHTAIGVVLAQRLMADPDWQGTVKLIFQPGEEGGRGAKPMVAAGVVDDLDYFFVGHLGCLLPSGKIAMEASDFFSSIRFDVTYTGKAAHAAMGPQNGANALLAGATAALGMHAIARHGEEATFVNVGKMVSGAARNIVAESCLLECDVRGATQEAREYMHRRAFEVINGAAVMHGCEVDISVGPELLGNENSPEAAEIIGIAAAKVEGIEEVVPSWPIGGGDDASFMIKRVRELGGKACYCLIGSDIDAIHHAKTFDFDETALEQGISLFHNVAQHLLKRA
ncbi:amidohydrolase [Pseudooceanicola nanhaiensis]|uniref:amidohydrolase n=1 Tax=Pseudooceanicola nanhaiensis TaxID=375761 RepID=UPI001CD6E066|nr:amidohydrolase [Pseudooceanicola nanhaiensis]MCA0920877.1 amidohydrolase [Pseudooceanicola nanhaiensis]